MANVTLMSGSRVLLSDGFQILRSLDEDQSNSDLLPASAPDFRVGFLPLDTRVYTTFLMCQIALRAFPAPHISDSHWDRDALVCSARKGNLEITHESSCVALLHLVFS